MKRSILIAVPGTLLAGHLSAQDSTKNNLTLSGYAEAYYSYDFNKPSLNSKAPFVYSYNRNNEVTVNLAYVKAAYNNDKIRANIALAAGTYVNANYAAEAGVLKNIYEANAGVKIARKANLWVDAGIFASHIGFESARGKDCWTLTRSIVADNSPYYESGAKISYTSSNNKWFLSALYLNGWQHIQRPDYNTTPAGGLQVTFTPSSKVILNYSNFIGNDKPDSARLMRYYHDFYGIFQLSDIMGVTAGLDVSMQQKEKGSSDFNFVYAPQVILKISPDSKNSIAARAEYYSDKNQSLISTGTEDGFKALGLSINYDRQILNNLVWRIELRNLHGDNEYFIKKDDEIKKNTTFVTTALAFSF
ncbi:porin [Parafilimonas sp.]|uniref:porin n=1 Tax=Parafilimonas sp. TaxID=1969739 RepID=UPI0039E24CE9